MKSIERFDDLMCRNTVEDWRSQVFKLGNDLGYEQTLLAITPNPNIPPEAEHAFFHSNYSPDWRKKYDAEKRGYIDPTIFHCMGKSIPLVWSPEIFSTREQKEMYEEACGYGLRAGVTLPIHGASGELGMLCFVTDTKPGKCFRQDANRNIPELSCLRDFTFETSLQFMKQSCSIGNISVTRRELECLKWSAAGKSSWEIGRILHCSEAVVNFHFSNIRRKFKVSSRQQAVVRAIGLGLIHPR